MRHLNPISAALIVLWATVPAVAQNRFMARLDSSQVVHNVSNSTATGLATFALEHAATGPQIKYSLQLDGLDLEPIPENRTDPNDVVGIHLHLHVPDVIGPHILNIFGIPSQDDADLVVDFQNESLTGIFDISDATRDQVTGEILNQAFPLTTKIVGDWIDELIGGELYIAVHSRDRAMNAPPGVDIHGHIFAVPEPAAGVLLWLSAGMATGHRRPRSSWKSKPAEVRGFEEV